MRTFDFTSKSNKLGGEGREREKENKNIKT